MDFTDLDIEFFLGAVVLPAKDGRHMAIGRLNGATTVVFVTLGGEAISIVSMRAASVKERKLL